MYDPLDLKSSVLADKDEHKAAQWRVCCLYACLKFNFLWFHTTSPEKMRATQPSAGRKEGRTCEAAL